MGWEQSELRGGVPLTNVGRVGQHSRHEVNNYNASEGIKKVSIYTSNFYKLCFP